MKSASATDSRATRRIAAGARGLGASRLRGALPGSLLVGALLLGSLALPGCSSNGDEPQGPETTVLSTRSGETLIQVTESDQAGNQVVRVKTVFRGQEANVVLNIDQQNYEVEIPLSVEQVMPRPAGASTATAENFQDLLIAQHLEKAQEATLNGDYNAALRQLNLVQVIRPDHVKAHEMKGSVYYAMGNYQLANEEWEQVLALDPSNQEVRDFQEFMKNRSGAQQPPLPGTSGPAPTPREPAAGAVPANNQEAQ